MANNAISDLVSAKKNLHNVLGDDMQRYYQLLKSWFKQKMTREDFDHEARKLLTQESVHLHNQFILALLCKCQSLGSSLARTSSTDGSKSSGHPPSPAKSNKKPKAKKRSYSSTENVPVNLLAVNPLVMAPHIQDQAPASAEEVGPAFCARTHLLPDAGMLHGRLIVGAWESALDDVTDSAVELLQQALELHLKNVLMAVFSRRSGYRLREKCFKYGFQSDFPETTNRNNANSDYFETESEATSLTSRGCHMPTVRPAVETALNDAANLVASDVTAPHESHVTLFDLYSALQVHKSAIPNHTVYATNMERIVNKLWHPSAEDLLHEQKHLKHVKAKQELYAEQLASSV